MDSALPDSRSRSAPAAGLWLAAGGGDFAAEDVTEALALDEALLEEAHDGVRIEPVVRTWMAQRPFVVVGSSSRVEEEVAVAACRSDGVPILRRPSGGATVILGPGCLMWSVVTPHPAGVPAVERIHAAMLDPLVWEFHLLGMAVSRQGTSDLVLAAEGPSGGQHGFRKVSGNALRVRRHGVLYHGTLLDDFDIPLAERLLRHPPREPAYRARRPHGAFLANLGLGRARLEELVRRAFGTSAHRRDVPWERVERLVRERYGDATWTHRL
jgi:lipoate-protein ligase A